MHQTELQDFGRAQCEPLGTRAAQYREVRQPKELKYDPSCTLY